ncbi:MAG: acyl-CoA dehydrogenase family protein, partial [Aestuariivirgaceae bacterium]
MDFELGEDQRAIQDLAAGFATKEMAPHAAKWDAQNIFPRDVIEKAAELGFGGLYARGDVGGSALTRLDAVVIFEELSKACPSTAAFISIHNMATWMVDSFGDDDQRSRLVPDLCTMQAIASYCLTEPSSGSDAVALRTTAVRSGGEYVLNGTKAFISGGGSSDLYVAMVRTGGADADGISCIAVPRDAPGLSFGAQEKKLGWHSQPTAMVIFEDCKVPAQNLVGGEGNGFKIAMAGLDGGRLNIAACSLGSAQGCLDMAIDYIGERKQFGRRLADFQALQFRIADMATELEAARLLLYKAAIKVETKAPDATRFAAMAKRKVT